MSHIFTVITLNSKITTAYNFEKSTFPTNDVPNNTWGWSGGVMVLGKLPVPGRPTIWITVGQGPTALAVGVGGGCLDIFTLIYPFSPLSPSLLETARYRLKYCLKGPLNPKQPTNQPNNTCSRPDANSADPDQTAPFAAKSLQKNKC